jgi:Holliday junction resolvase RusA-like endonuclease
MSYQRGRASVTGEGKLFVYTPAAMTHYQNRVRNAFAIRAREEGRIHEYPWDLGPVEANIIAYYPLPQSGRVTERSRCKVTKDVDNIAKCILDSLNYKKTVKLTKKNERTGKSSMVIVRDAPYTDDRLIRRLSVAKVYSESYVGSMVTLDFYIDELAPTKGRKR